MLNEKFKKDIYCEIDGYYVFGTPKGSLSSADLRKIADTLNEMNKKWDEEVKATMIRSG